MSDDWKPADLGKRGSALWDRVASRYGLRPDELAILAEACYEADIIDQLQAEFKTSPLITKGSMGQDVAAPHVSEIRQHRTVYANLLAKLRLPDEQGGQGSSSAAGRALVSARWHPRTG